MGKYFGTDGFRGVAGESITCRHAFMVGRYLGHFCANGGVSKIVIGKDPRRSSYMLEYALAAGVAASGGESHTMHVTTTASVSYATRTGGFDCGVMISASHNPYTDNGIKIFNAQGEKADESLLNGLEAYLDGEDDLPLASGDKVGRTVDGVAARNRYIGHLISLASRSYQGLKIGLDCANGSAFAIAPAIFRALGAQVTCIGDNPDGFNVNLGCGSTKPQALQALVKERGLDVGFAFDGDADRCICVNERGEVVDGDGILYVCASYLKSVGALTGDRVVTTVMSNGALPLALAGLGIACSQTAVGDRFVYEEMTRTKAAIGGESSGHVIFSKLENTGDGLVTAINVCEVLCERKSTLGKLLQGFTPFPQEQVSVRVKDKMRVCESPAFCQAVAWAQEQLLGGKLIVRPSGTEPVLRIMAECGDKNLAKEICQRLQKAAEQADL